MRTRVRQGCLLSPLLFLVTLDWVTRTAFARSRTIQWSVTTSLEDLGFADDLALLSHRIQDMKDETKALEKQSAKVGLKINATKTKLMRVCTKQDDGVMIAAEYIEEVNEFRYLGSIVSKKGGTDEDIQARIRKARQAFAMLRPIWRQGTNNQDQVESLWVKREGRALVWCGNLETDQRIEAEVAGVH